MITAHNPQISVYLVLLAIPQKHPDLTPIDVTIGVLLGVMVPTTVP
ncbi:hypothetical protein L0A91_10135 [Ornithinimicrobium sp. INDO-MA30-4]|nr:hypothetical protein [Ornithinimicrobium sp. INDO-MA30-4]UJH71702.1 hypothetical protein L0A91_10135 [Ornithinimicrobium sp. INDO-MA30-4]